MQETVQQYMQRTLGYVEGQDPVKVQQATVKKLEKLVKGKTNKQLTKRPAPDKWSIAEILAHLADAEVVASWRLRLVLGENGAPIKSFNQDSWASVLNYGKSDAKWSLTVFRTLRENNLRMLKGIPRNLWENYGTHDERGKETVAHIVRMFAGHDMNHLQQVERIARNKQK